MRNIRSSLGWFMMLGTVILAPSSVYAAGITVSPAFQDIILPSMAASKDVVVTYTNQSSSPQTYRLSAVDFGSLDESGGVAFLGVPNNELEHRYGLASWITIDRDQMYLAPAGTTKVTVHIDNRASLAPGGHYAALIATSIADPGTPADSTRVNLRQVIASLLLVRKEGAGEIGLNAAGLVLGGHSIFKLPNAGTIRFQNPGNVHVVPRGTMTVIDPAGRTVASGIINENSDIILPESFRRIAVSMHTLGVAWAPGKYQMTAKYRYDGSADIRQSTVSFWYLGSLLTGLVIIGLAALILASWYVLRRRHIKS